MFVIGRDVLVDTFQELQEKNLMGGPAVFSVTDGRTGVLKYRNHFSCSIAESGQIYSV